MDKLEKICRRITESTYNPRWQWEQGVALFGLSEVYAKRGAVYCLDYIKKWVDKHLDMEYPGKSINTTAPCLSVLELYKVTGEKKYGDLLEDFAQWCISQAPRSERGAYEHSCTDNFYDNQIWADTLFMGALFLAKYSLLTGKRMYMNEALRQYVLHYQFLKAPGHSLIVHGYYGNEREQRGVIWGRGNGWFAAGSAIILSLADESYADYSIVKQNFVNYIDELVTYQNPNGGWNTVIDDPDSYEEMTATAAFAFAINEGIRLGIIDKKYSQNAEMAIAVLIDNIDEEGNVLNASGGTCIMPSKDQYNAIIVRYTEFAQGLAMLALNSV